MLYQGKNVYASGFGDAAQLRPYLSPSLRNLSIIPLASPVYEDMVHRYFSGTTDVLSAIAIDYPPETPPFYRKVYDVLRHIPTGCTMTYQEVADRAGAPRGARAVGSACRRNPIALLVPCHRVVPAVGGTGDYAYGREVKAFLLQHESMREKRTVQATV